MPWIPLSEGLAFKPIAFGPGDRRRLLLRVQPETVVARHRHRGEVHAFNVSGTRMILGPDMIIGPQTYVYEPVGNVDSWKGIGDEPCVVHIDITGAMEYLDDDGRVISVDDTRSLQEAYLAWCSQEGQDPHPALAEPARI